MENASDFNDSADRILVGPASEMLETLPSGSVQTAVTSPPYFGLRKYSEEYESEIGRESSPEVYVSRLVKVMEEVGRVLKSDGTLWLNLGDTYVNGRLQGVPWRVALALQDAGWMLRSDVIWHKPNAMPSSVKNRPTTDHEYIFLLSRNKDYFYDADAIREPHKTFSDESKMKGGRGHFGKAGGTPEAGKNAGQANLHRGRWDQAFHPLGRNKRTVWSVPLGKFRGAHFAVFPPALIEPCILASSRPGDVVLDPFMGAGTTAVVAKELGRRYLGVELVPAYAQMAEQRIQEVHDQLEFESE